VTPFLRTQALRDLRPHAPAADSPRAAALHKLVPEVLKTLGLDQRLYESQIFERWAEIVGPAAAEFTKPAALKHGRLIVHVPHSIHVQTFRPLVPEMLKAVQRRLGPKCIREILLRVGM